MTGFRNEFFEQAPYDKSADFDEILGYGVGYAYHEDIDVSLRLQRQGYALVCRRRRERLPLAHSRGSGPTPLKHALVCDLKICS